MPIASVRSSQNRWTRADYEPWSFRDVSLFGSNPLAHALLVTVFLAGMGPGGGHPQFAGLSPTKILGFEWD